MPIFHVVFELRGLRTGFATLERQHSDSIYPKPNHQTLQTISFPRIAPDLFPRPEVMDRTVSEA